jgi:hypothetical protein
MDDFLNLLLSLTLVVVLYVVLIELMNSYLYGSIIATFILVRILRDSWKHE